MEGRRLARCLRMVGERSTIPTDTASALWRRLDTPGHDAAWLERTPDGWLLWGTAVFRGGDTPACLAYEVACDRSWATKRGAVRGRIGDALIAHEITRNDGGWVVDGVPVAGIEDLVDLDFGFTPATNLLQLRRVELAVGAAAEVPVAWFDGEGGPTELVRLPQRYERRREDTYWYESPTASYAGELVVGPDGFALRYPGLWEAVRET
jgi:uncharacterized protein